MRIEMPLILAVSSLLVLIGIWGVMRHKADMMRALMSLQVVFLGILLNFSLGSSYHQSETGFIFALFVVCATAVYMTVALTLFYLYYRRHPYAQEDRKKEDNE